jgi:hypothetical protein
MTPEETVVLRLVFVKDGIAMKYPEIGQLHSRTAARNCQPIRTGACGELQEEIRRTRGTKFSKVL